MDFSEIIPLLKKGHKVKREAWDDNYWIRICNANTSKDFKMERDSTSIYLHGTDGYFHHLGSSSRTPKEDKMGGGRSYEGLQYDVFAEDWIDGGYISRDDFEKLTNKHKEELQKISKEKYDRWAKDFAKRHYG